MGEREVEGGGGGEEEEGGGEVEKVEKVEKVGGADMVAFCK